MVFSDNLPKRQKEILEIVAQIPSIRIPELSEKLGVSTTTIRNDLSALASRGLIHRTHGKILPAFHPNITSRQKTMVNEKNRIAQAAAELVQDDDTIMIGAGTTAALIPKYLLGKRDVHIITYSTLVLPYVRTNPAIRLTLIGGEFRPYTESLAGSYAAVQLDRFHARIVFFGADGFSLEHGITANLVEDAAMVEKIISRCDLKILVADSSKYNQKGSVSFLPMNKIDMLICDKGLPEEAYNQLKAQIQVKLV